MRKREEPVAVVRGDVSEMEILNTMRFRELAGSRVWLWGRVAEVRIPE